MDVGDEKGEGVQIVVDRDDMCLFYWMISVVTQLGLTAFGDVEFKLVIPPEIKAIVDRWDGYESLKYSSVTLLLQFYSSFSAKVIVLLLSENQFDRYPFKVKVVSDFIHQKSFIRLLDVLWQVAKESDDRSMCW